MGMHNIVVVQGTLLIQSCLYSYFTVQQSVSSFLVHAPAFSSLVTVIRMSDNHQSGNGSSLPVHVAEFTMSLDRPIRTRPEVPGATPWHQ
jgi:hypothetical protein